MYKTHLGEWGFAKNFTEKRVKSLLNQKMERGAVGKVPQFAKEGKAIDHQRITKYLKRKKMSMEEFCDIEMHTPSLPLRNPPSLDAHPNPIHSQRPHSPQPSAHISHENNCPYQPGLRNFA
jgi:hypothetical protein